METILRGAVPIPEAPTLLYNLAHCFLTERLWPFLVPDGLLFNSSLDFSSELIVNTQPDLSRLSASWDRSLPDAVCSDSDMSSLQPGWESEGQAGRREGPFSQEPLQVHVCISKASLETELFFAV